MKTSASLLSMVLLSAAAACGSDGGSNLPVDGALPIDAAVIPNPDGNVGGPVDVPASEITANTTWTSNNVYTLKGLVFVRGATLTIQPGTVIKGDVGSALVITSDAKIEAQGTAASPIVFTSSKATLTMPEPAAPAGPAPSDWGGVVLLGKAPINHGEPSGANLGTTVAEGFTPGSADEAKTRYGGADAAHDCGTLRYVRIEYAGFQQAMAKELNALTVNACGSGTELDYIQTHLGSDDGVEFFGGSASIKHLVVSQADDDSMDWEYGWSGTAQFVVLQRNDRNTSAERGIEADNHTTSADAAPRSVPTIWNLTMVGQPVQADATGSKGISFRTKTGAHVHNAIVMDYKGGAIDMDSATLTASQTGTAHWPTLLSVDHTYLFNSTNTQAVPNAGVFALLNDSARNNRLNTNPMLTAPGNLAAPSFKPVASSPVLTGCGTPPAGFDAAATFCGAIGGTDWTLGWTRYP